MAQDLSGLYISQSFQNLVQRSASGAFNVLATATGTEFIPISASYAISASKAQSVVSASYAVSSSRAVSASRADSALSASYAVTASFAENATVNNLQEVLTAGNSASIGFTVTGSSIISGSLRVKKKLISGEFNNTSTSIGPVAIIGGENNTIDGSTQYGIIAGATRGTIESADATGILAGFRNTARGTYNAIVGGTLNTIDNGGSVRKGNVIIGGNSNLIPATVSGSVIIGGQNITASRDNEVTVPALDVKNRAIVSGSAIISSSAQLLNDYSVESIGNARVIKNVAGQNATLVIQDDAQNSFTEGPTLQFSGSKVGLLKSDGQTNVRFEMGRDFEWTIGSGGLAQFNITKEAQSSGDFKIEDKGSRSARYIHENQNETGSIRFANPTKDVGVAIRMDDNKMALQMYSGSAFVPIIQRASGSKQVNLYDSTSSTGSSAQVLTSNANGGIEWAAGGGGGAAFPYTGSAQITGSLSVTGSTTIEGKVNIQSGANSGSANTTGLKDFLTVGYNNNNNTINGTIIGANNTVNGENSSIFGGDSVTINSSYNSSMGAFNSTIDNTADASAMLGGYQNTLGGVRSALVGGRNNDIQASSDFGAIVGGFQNTIATGVTASAIIGGKNIVASKSNTAYVNGLEVTSLGANITGSIIGSGNIRAGQNAAAFASDSIELGSATVPVQYGNIIIHGSNTRDLGNKYNGFQIQAVGGNTIQFANSAFTGLGNDVHLFSMGANSVGRTDSIKLWSSGSGADLNLSTDVVIQSGNKLTMSGSIELANSTGSVGQVIGVDASGKAKWETASGGGGGITSFQLSPRTSSYTQATAPGCDYVFQTASIAGGTFAVGDILEIRSMLEQTGGSGTTYLTFNVYQGNVAPGAGYPGGSGDLPLAQSQNSADGKLYVNKTLYINSATETSVWNTGNPNDTAYNAVAGGDPIQNLNIDWTQDQTFYYGACIDNAGHTLKNYGGIIRKLNG